MTSGRAVPRRVIPGSPFNTPRQPAPPVEQYAVDDRVTHDRHGLGTVVRVVGEREVVVDFGTEIRRIALPSAKLTKL